MARSKIKISKDKLKDLYLNKKLSLDLITREFCCSERTIFADYMNIKFPYNTTKREMISQKKD